MKNILKVFAAFAGALLLASCSNPFIDDDSNSGSAVTAKKPQVKVLPTAASYKVGGNATLTAIAFSPDDGELSYQWYVGNDELDGETSETLVSEESVAGTYSYHVVVTNTLGGTTAKSESKHISVEVTDKKNAATPQFKSKLVDADVALNESVVLDGTATIDDNGELSYKWYEDGEEIPGETSATYAPKTDSKKNVVYKVIATNTNTKDSDIDGERIVTNSMQCSLSVGMTAKKPVITVQPNGGSYELGAEATALSVTATRADNGTLSYQWYLNGEKIAGATESTYKPSTAKTGSYTYQVEVTNSVAADDYKSTFSDEVTV